MEDTSLAEDFEEIFPEDEEINITEEVLKWWMIFLMNFSLKKMLK
jgi:hypothetical protein